MPSSSDNAVSPSHPTPPAFPSPSRKASRRARLERLREEAEPLTEEERRTAVRGLLQNPLLTPDGDHAALFALVRRHHGWLADWFAHHADWSLVVTAESARLRKIPARSDDATRGAVEPKSEEPFTRARYVVFCLALVVLERSERQITLARLAELVAVTLASDPALGATGFHWSLDDAPGRRDFVHTLRMLIGLGVLRRLQGDEERLIHDRASDALYSIRRPVLSHLLAARRSPSLVTATDFSGQLDALLDASRPDSPDARNRALRTEFVRRLLDDPVLYYDSLDEEARAYLDRQRPFLLDTLTTATGLHAEVRAEGLALVDLEGDCTDAGIPEEGTEGHLTLLLATWLAERLRRGEASPVPLNTLRQQTARLIRLHRHHWRREVEERGAEVWLTGLVVDRLTGLSLVERDGDALRPRPALGRFSLRDTAGLAAQPETEALPNSP